MVQAETVASLRIVVVDDYEDGADTIAQLLRLWGHQVRIATDGNTGVEAAARFRPDLNLMDIGMPKLDGLEAARMVRVARGQAVTLVALTAYSSDVVCTEGRKSDFDYYLVKPAGLANLPGINFRGSQPQNSKREGRRCRLTFWT
jgi:CheY-like chemotaxis protein